jgi:hypothetical protein
MEDLIWTLGNCHFPMNRYTSEVVCKWKYDEQKKARGFFETGHLGFFWECSKRPLSPDEFKSILDGHFDKLFARELDQCREQKNDQCREQKNDQGREQKNDQGREQKNRRTTNVANRRTLNLLLDRISPTLGVLIRNRSSTPFLSSS